MNMTKDTKPMLPPESAFNVPAAWKGCQLDDSSWIWHASAALIAELETAARSALTSGKTEQQLTSDDFNCPILQQQSDRWLDELDKGLGFILLRGLPVQRWGKQISAMAYLALGLSLGTLASQNAAGDILGHVRDAGLEPTDPSVRLYRTKKAQPFHTDGADIIGLLCLQPSKQGGLSRIVSSISVLKEIHEQRPDLAPLLYQNFHFDRNDEQKPGAAPSFQLPIAHWQQDRLGVFYIDWYIRNAPRHPGVAELTDKQIELLDLIDATALKPSLYLDMEFVPGDIQLLKNSTILHSRTEYQDWQDAEKKRHLLRLWVAVSREFSGSDSRLKAGVAKKAGVMSDGE